jgi:RNA polymerase sigma-70 factor, ECF subfamily
MEPAVVSQAVLAAPRRCDEQLRMVAGLFDQFQAAIFGYLCRLTDDRNLAEELAQETFLKVFQARGRLAEVENQRAWLYRIATNTAFSALRRRKRFAWLPWSAAEELRPASGDPAEQVSTWNIVESCLCSLSLRYRAPLLLYAYDGLSVREVAQVLGISEGAVRTRVYRAREMFEQAYERENRK